MTRQCSLRCSFVLLSVLLGTISAASEDGPPASEETQQLERNHYGFKVMAPRFRRPVTFRIQLNVDGVERVLEDATTPFEFECEAANTMVGRIETLDGREVKFEVDLSLPGGRRNPLKRVQGNPIDFRWKSEDGAQNVGVAFLSK